MRKSIAYILLAAFLVGSCSQNNCESRFDFKLSSQLLAKASDKDYSYCNLIEQSLNGKSEAIKNLSLLSFDAGFAYEHGAVLIEVIDSIGEDEYARLIMELPEEERKEVFYSLRAGFDFTQNSNYKNSNFEKSFPELYKIYLNN